MINNSLANISQSRYNYLIKNQNETASSNHQQLAKYKQSKQGHKQVERISNHHRSQISVYLNLC